MCGDCQYLHERRTIRKLVYCHDQPLNTYDESLIDSMMTLLKLRSPKESAATLMPTSPEHFDALSNRQIHS